MSSYTLFMLPVPQDERPRRVREDATVRELVAQAFGPEAVKSNMPSGVPVISIGANIIHVPFSISHCSTHAALAVGEGCRAIGVDVENFREKLRRVAPRFLADEEILVRSTDEALLAAWTLKEAAYKAALTPGLELKSIRLPEEGSDLIVIPERTLRIALSEACGDAFVSVVIDD